jgi:hypothetical protein
MKTFHFYKARPPMDYKVLRVAVVFLFCAFINMLANAGTVNTVDGLDINRVELLGNNELQLSQGDETSMQYRSKKDNTKRPPFSVHGKTLRLGVDEKGNRVNQVKYKVTVTELESLLVKGSGEAYIRPLDMEDLVIALHGSGAVRAYEIKANKLELKLDGSGNIQAEAVEAKTALLHLKGSGDLQLGSLNADKVTTNLDGSGDIDIDEEGRVDDLKIRLLGSGDVSLGKLQATRADVTIMGSGDIEVWAESELEAEILGSGDVRYTGSPTISDSVFGSGELRQRDQ